MSPAHRVAARDTTTPFLVMQLILPIMPEPRG